MPLRKPDFTTRMECGERLEVYGWPLPSDPASHTMNLEDTIMDEATLNVVQRVLAAYGSQRDNINDSDLDDEQPLSLQVYLSLGDIRRARMMVRLQGKNPADFRVRAKECDCGAETTGKWADKHTRGCASLEP